MKKLTATISSLDLLKSIEQYLSSIVIPTKYSFNEYNMSNEDLNEIINYALNKNIEVIINIDMISTDKIGSSIKKFIKSLDERIVLLVSDLGLYSYFKDTYKVIYSSSTLVCNKTTFNYYINDGSYLVMPSTEITLNEILSFNLDRMIYPIFGYLNMMTSRRKLLTTFKDFSKTRGLKKEAFLKEELRDDFYKIVEYKYHSVIYRSNPVCFLEFLNLMKDIKYLYLINIFIDDNKYIKVVEIFYNHLNGIISKEDALKEYNDLNIPYKNKFINESTVYKKEEF